eukprot:TRINITY_DN12480_c6_g1_i3.p1 TRINITY_DN12480_c6_g1~~TRINITY_DN12480_c6_g1_i3.p1  ORF type:complete len:229 (+),score=22.87 TRINITY_DN12480_c6_g1_i3:255-941(+)
MKIKTDRLQTLRLTLKRGNDPLLQHSTIDTRCERLELQNPPDNADVEASVPKQQSLIERTQCSMLQVELAAVPFFTDPLPRVKVVTLFMHDPEIPLDEVNKLLKIARHRFPNVCSIHPNLWNAAPEHFTLCKYYSAGAPAEAIGRTMVLNAHHCNSDATYLYQDMAKPLNIRRCHGRRAMLQLLGDFAMATSIYDRDRALTPLNIPDTVWSALFRAMYLTGPSDRGIY